MAVLREDAEIRRAEHEVETQHLQERVHHLGDQLQKTQSLLYDSGLKYILKLHVGFCDLLHIFLKYGT